MVLALAASVVVALAIAGAARPLGVAQSAPVSLDLQYIALEGHTFLAFSLDTRATAQTATRPPAALTLTSPTGVSPAAGLAPGTQVGTLIGVISARADASDAVFGTGTVVVADPTAFAADAVAQSCAPGPHATALRISFSVVGQTISFPAALDPAPGGSGIILRVCTVIPPGADFPRGLILWQSSLVLRDLIAGATGPNAEVWNVRVTPTIAATFTPDPAAAYDVRARISTSHVLTATARYDAKRKVAEIRGRLTLAGAPRAGATVNVILSSSRGAVAFDGGVTTGADGTFVLRRPIRGKTYVRLSVESETGPCHDASDAPAGCLSETLAGPDDVEVLVRPPLATDPKLRTDAAGTALARRATVRGGDLPAGWRAAPIDFETCEAFSPDLHRLTVRGRSFSPYFISAKQDASVASATTVFASAREAKSAFGAVAQLAHARCEANVGADADYSIETVAPAGFPPVGDAVRAFHVAWSSEEGKPLSLDLVFVRVGRTVLELELFSYDGPRPALLRSVVKAVAARA